MEERLQATLRLAEDRLQRVDDQLLPIESVMSDPTSSRDVLEAFRTHNMPEADRLLDELQGRFDEDIAKEPRLAALGERITTTRQQLGDMQRTLDMRLRDIDEEQQMYQQMNEKMQEIETMLDNLSTNEQRPQPLSQATQDRNLLRIMLEQLNTIDDTSLRNPNNRTAVRDRSTKIAARLQVG